MLDGLSSTAAGTLYSDSLSTCSHSIGYLGRVPRFESRFAAIAARPGDEPDTVEVAATLPGYPGWKITATVDVRPTPPDITRLEVKRGDLESGDGPPLIDRTVAKVGAPEIRFNLSTGRMRVSEPGAIKARSVGAEMLRAVRVSDLASAVNHYLGPMGGRLANPELAAHAEVALPNPAKRTRERRGDDRYYAKWAKRYADSVAAGSRSPNVDLAKKYRKSATEVRDIIVRCRRRGMLSGTRTRAPGGHLTPAALEVLGLAEPR